MHDILIIIPYFGELLPWIDYFIQSCKTTPSVNWLLYGNSFQKISELPENIKVIPATLSDFNRLASDKLYLKISVRHSYKICDLKPAFGEIFESFLLNYKFWGYSDLDLIYGNIGNFINKPILENYDVITTREEFLTGHFTLFRNHPDIVKLYKTSNIYKKIFQNTSRHYAFDERINVFGRRLFLSEQQKRSQHCIRKLEKLIHKIRYKFISTNRKETDMTHICFRAQKNGHIKLYRRNLVKSDIWYYKKGKSQWEISWVNGCLTNEEREELLHFHFLKSKKSSLFCVEPWEPNKSFIIKPEGIFINYR